VAGSCEYGDEPSGSDATELVSCALAQAKNTLCGRSCLSEESRECCDLAVGLNYMLSHITPERQIGTP
jgi:hypothetical protein